MFFPSVEQAMWDLQGQILGLPLYKLLGGGRKRVPAYASGLEFHLTDAQVAAFYAGTRAAGFSTFKVKVGRPIWPATSDGSGSSRKSSVASVC